MTEFSLAEDFAPVDRDVWLALVDKTLKGADFEKSLVATTRDGLKIQPLYDRSEGLSVPRKPTPGWAIMQRADMPSPVDANAQALHDLETGASGLTLLVAGHGGPAGFGVEARTADDFERLLEGVHLEMIPLRLEGGLVGDEAASALLALYAGRGVDPGEADLILGVDPIGRFAMHGTEIGRKTLPDGFPADRPCVLFQADGRTFHDAGASEAQELAATAACAVGYMRWLEAAGVSVPLAVRQVSMLLSVDADMFLSAAKLRAARLLWARIQEAMDVPPVALKLHAETGWRMMSRLDPHVNLLRATAATFAAAIAGADGLTVLPFTSALGLADRFARRMAKNVQLILAEESNLGHVADPAAGSGFMDRITHELAADAWTGFREIEAHGGIVDALSSGLVQKRIAETRTARSKDVAGRREAMTGVSEFPHLAESPVETLAPLPPPTAAPENALPPHRTAEPYEILRDASDRYLRSFGSRPKIFLANLGSVADFTPRATWAANLFEAGGVEALHNDGFEDHKAMAAAFGQSGTSMCVICSSDDVYAAEAAEAARALAGAGAARIHLAGRPDDDLSAAGVTAFVHAGCDILAVLKDAHDALGVSS